MQSRTIGCCEIQVRERTVKVLHVTLRVEVVVRPVTECVEVIKEVARNETQQVQKQVTKPELQLVERIDEMRP